MEESFPCTFLAGLRLVSSCCTTATMGIAADSVTAMETAVTGTTAFATLDASADDTSDLLTLGRGCATLSDLVCAIIFSAFGIPLMGIFRSFVFDGNKDERMGEREDGTERGRTGAEMEERSDARIELNSPFPAALDAASISKANWFVSSDICKYVTPPITSIVPDICS